MEITFSSEIIEWRGPAPFLFAPLPESYTQEIKDIAKYVTYGWGIIPCDAIFGSTRVTTSLTPKDGRYLLPVKIAVQRAESIELGDTITATILIDLPSKFQ